MNNMNLSGNASGRILSVDFFRGFAMFMLIGESSGFFSTLVNHSQDRTILSAIGAQLEHAEWNGLHFWDLIQPFFMFIVGVAMPFAMTRRWNRGDSWNQTLQHALTRSALLLFLGWALYCIGAGKIIYRFTNVLAQLSVTYLIAFLIMRMAVKWQLLISFLLILVSDLLYQLWNVKGFDKPYTPDQNFGSWFDMVLTGSLSGGHWVAFNAIPTAAHTIWGVIAGMLLMSNREPARKIYLMAAGGIVLLFAGYSMGLFIPIIKRICTSSFVIVSGGWCLLALALSYWLIEVKKLKKPALFFAIVGMNPLFIYLFAHTGGTKWLTDIVVPFIQPLSCVLDAQSARMLSALTVWAMLWGICYFLYKNRIFIRL